MFTGIVEEVGRVAAIERHDGHARLWLRCETVVADASLGDSISVNGCCLTATTVTDDGFAADLMAETLRATALGTLSEGDPVNLERAMAAGARFGGHLVQGHVDGVAEILALDEVEVVGGADGETRPGTVLLTIAAPDPVSPYLVAKGSVTVDGVSLTIVDRGTDRGLEHFRVGLIPHTLAVTTFGSRRVGDRVNLEADVVAKYVERLLAAGAETPYTPR